MALLICPDCKASLYTFRGHVCPNEKKARAAVLADAKARENPVAKEPEADGATGKSRNRGSSRVRAGRTAQDGPKAPKAGAVAIPKRGRPRKPDDQLSRASRYRRKKEAKK